MPQKLVSFYPTSNLLTLKAQTPQKKVRMKATTIIMKMMIMMAKTVLRIRKKVADRKIWKPAVKCQRAKNKPSRWIAKKLIWMLRVRRLARLSGLNAQTIRRTPRNPTIKFSQHVLMKLLRQRICAMVKNLIAYAPI